MVQCAELGFSKIRPDNTRKQLIEDTIRALGVHDRRACRSGRDCLRGRPRLPDPDRHARGGTPCGSRRASAERNAVAHRYRYCDASTTD